MSCPGRGAFPPGKRTDSSSGHAYDGRLGATRPHTPAIDSPSGKPSRAAAIAGSHRVEIGFDPNRSCSVHQPSNAPGIVTAMGPCSGTKGPGGRRSSEAADGAAPLPLSP